MCNNGRMKTKPRKIKTTVEAGIPIREVRPGYYLVDCYHHGKRERQCFKLLADAKTHCQALRIKIRNEGLSFLSLNSKQRADAIEALSLMAGRGSLVEAAQAFNKLNPVGKVESVADSVAKYLETMQADGAREISIREKRQKLAKLDGAYGDRPTASIQKSDLQRLADELGYKGSNGKKYVSAWQSVLNLYHGERKAKSGGDKNPAVTFKPDVVRNLFSIAEADYPEIVPVFTLLFFAGLRPDEVQRMTWENIDFHGRSIRVDASMSKTRDPRNVKLQDAAAAWLAKYRKRKGLVSPSKSVTRRLRESVMSKAGLDSWPNDVARHTYATAHYMRHGDSAATCKELGHFGSQSTFRRHYKGLYSEYEADAFWRILPDGHGEVIQLAKSA